MLTLVLPCVPEPHFMGGKGRESALEVTDVLGFVLTRALLEPARLLLSNWGRAGLSTESQGVIKQGCLGHHWGGVTSTGEQEGWGGQAGAAWSRRRLHPCVGSSTEAHGHPSFRCW